MRLLLLLVELVAIVGVVAAAVWVYLSLQRRQLRRGRWRVATRSLRVEEGDGEGVVVELERAGERPQRVALIPSTLPPEEFAGSLAEAESDAEAKAAALNAGLTPARR